MLFAPLLLLAVSLLVCAVAGWKLPWGTPMVGYLFDAGEWARTGRIADSFTPLEYPMFLGLAMRLDGVRGIVAAQALLQTAVAMLGYGLLRQLRAGRWLAFFGGVMLLLHPDLLTSITKVWDVGLPAALLLLTAWLCALLLRSKCADDARGWLAVAALGISFGADLSTRPNLVLLLPLGLWAAIWPWRKPAFNRWRLAVAGALFLLCTGLSFAELARLEHGSFFTPGNGPYNLYAGNNRFSAKWLHKNLNAEPSLFECWKADHGPNYGTNLYDPRLNPWYLEHVEAFVREHPVEDAGLSLLKLWTLLRPDTKIHPLPSPDGILKVTLALPAFVFFGLLLWPGGPHLEPIDGWLVAASVLYVVPFMITNADPHLRTPMDAVWICAILRLGSRRWAVGENRRRSHVRRSHPTGATVPTCLPTHSKFL
jgi:hypothetical protein